MENSPHHQFKLLWSSLRGKFGKIRQFIQCHFHKTGFFLFPVPSSHSIIPYLCVNHLLKSHFDVSVGYFSLQVNVLPFFHHLGSPLGPATFRQPQRLGIVLPLFCLTYRAKGCIRMHRINFGEVLDRHVEGYLEVAKKMWVFFPNKKKRPLIPFTCSSYIKKKHCGLQ